jgi:hypothetical protein
MVSILPHDDLTGVVLERRVSVRAASQHFGYNQQYLRRLLRAGRLQGVRIGPGLAHQASDTGTAPAAGTNGAGPASRPPRGQWPKQSIRKLRSGLDAAERRSYNSVTPKVGRTRLNRGSLRPGTSSCSSLLKRSGSESWLRPGGGLNRQQPQLPSSQVPSLAVFLKC